MKTNTCKKLKSQDKKHLDYNLLQEYIKDRKSIEVVM